MRVILGLLSGLVGMLAGWFGLAILVATLAGPDRDGGTAMGAFFQIGPIGGVIGFIVGVWLFSRIGIVRESVSPPDADVPGTAAASRSRISFPFAVTLVLLVAGLGWWAWYELIRSPYLSHGFMRLELQFKLPPGMTLPAREDVRIEVQERQGYTVAELTNRWHGHDGDRQVILTSASLMYKTPHRLVTLTLPNQPAQSWRLDLSSDPDPTPGYSDWRVADGTPSAKVEMNFRLSADR
jgi:MFS family permease